ncbi:MAG: class I SAM-dependent methyltransferase, partial [Planctomycetota bacterium]
DWDRRAREDARSYIATTNFASEEAFASSGARDVAHFFEGLEACLHPDAVVLDVGCGVGRMDAFVAPRVRRLIALDVSGEMLARARARLRHLPNVTFLEGDGSTLAPIPDASVDLVFSHIVFQHVPRRIFAAYLPEVRRVLRAGGDFLLQLPDGLGHAPEDPPESDTLNLRFYTEEEARRRLEAAGLAWVGCRRFRVGSVFHPVDYLRIHARR